MTTTTTDRYVTYKNIDCEGNAKRLMEMLLWHIDQPERCDLFWDKFKEKLAQCGNPDENSGRCLDELFLIHTYVNNLYEIFEQYEDSAALDLLSQIERECC